MSRARRRRAAVMRGTWEDRHLRRWAKAIRHFGWHAAGHKAFPGRFQFAETVTVSPLRLAAVAARGWRR